VRHNGGRLAFGPDVMLWASTGVKDPDAPDTLYVTELAAPNTIDTMPGKTIEAVADHGELHGPMSTDSSEAEAMLARFAEAGVDIDALAEKLQVDGAAAFVKSWKQLMERIAEQGEVVAAS